MVACSPARFMLISPPLAPRFTVAVIGPPAVRGSAETSCRGEGPPVRLGIGATPWGQLLAGATPPPSKSAPPWLPETWVTLSPEDPNATQEAPPMTAAVKTLGNFGALPLSIGISSCLKTNRALSGPSQF